MSTPPPMIFIKIPLYFGIYEYRYAPGTSKLDTLRLSCTSIISVQNNASKYTVVNETLSNSLIYIFLFTATCKRPYLYFPHVFSFIRFTDSSHLLLFWKIICPAVREYISRSILLDPLYFFGCLKMKSFFIPSPFSSLREQYSLLFFILFLF